MSNPDDKRSPSLGEILGRALDPPAGKLRLIHAALQQTPPLPKPTHFPKEVLQ